MFIASLFKWEVAFLRAHPLTPLIHSSTLTNKPYFADSAEVSGWALIEFSTSKVSYSTFWMSWSLSLINGEIKVFTKTVIVFKLINDYIQHVLANVKIGFKKSNKVLTWIWVEPDAVLDSDEPDVHQRAAQFLAQVLATFGNVKYEYAPLFCPSVEVERSPVQSA